jgi:hypothetical protein
MAPPSLSKRGSVGDIIDPLLGALAPLLNEIPGVPGLISILEPLLDSLSATQVGALTLGKPTSSTPTTAFMAGEGMNATTETETSNAFMLNASNSTQTQMYLVRADDSNTTLASLIDSNSTEIPVTFRIPVYLSQAASVVAYCATYDSNPPAPAPLTAQPCMNDTTTTANASPNNTTTMTNTISQLFGYNPASGVIRPIWAQTDPMPAGTMVNGTDAQLPSSSMNDTMSGDAAVTLVFTPSIASANVNITTSANDALPTTTSSMMPVATDVSLSP